MSNQTFGEEMVDEEAVTAEPAKSKYVTTHHEDDGPSLLDELADVAAQAITSRVKLEIDPRLRPGGWILEFDAVIEAHEVRRWQRAATNNGKTKAENADTVLANGLELLDKNVGIWKGERQVFDADGDPLTLTSTEWLTKVMKQRPDRPDTMDALKKFIGDAQILTMGSALLKFAGYTDEMVPVDPTQG